MKQERAGKQKEKTVKYVLIPALFSMLVGIAVWGYEVYNLIQYPKNLESLVMGCVGIVYILIGICSIRMAKTDLLYFIKYEATKQERIMVVALAYCTLVLSIVWVVYAISMGFGNALIASCMSIMSIICLSCSFLLYTDFGLEIVNSFMPECNRVGNQYFRNINLRDEYNRFLRYENPAERYDIMQKKQLMWIVFVIIVILIVILYSINTFGIRGRGNWYYLAASVLPLSFYGLAWCNGHHAAWREDTSEDIIWKSTHFTVFWPAQLVILLEWLCVNIPMIMPMHCIRGFNTMLLVGVVIFAVLWGISSACVGWKISNIKDYLWNGIFTFAIAIGVTCSIFLSTYSNPEYIEVTVVKTDLQYIKLGALHYVTVQMEDGKQIKLTVSKMTYDSINQGKEVVLNRYDGMLETEFLEICVVE